jgi:thioredoxin 1
MQDSEILKKISEGNLILIYFSQPECSVCKSLRPKVEALVSDDSGIEFLYVDILATPVLRGQYLIFAIPTIILFYSGKEVRRWSRFMSVQDIEQELQRYRSEK